jgi:hypothetical protein
MLSPAARIAAFLLIALAAPAANPNHLTDAERRQGWRLLFDGQSTAGWQEITGKPFPTNCWTIENGSLKALVRTDGFQDIRTNESFLHFDLQFDWKMGGDSNSGVKYLIQKVDEWTNQQGRQARARGLEYQLAGDANPDAASDPRRVAGSLYSLIAPVPRVPPHIGAVNHSRLVVTRDRIEHWLNGTKVIDVDPANPVVQKLLRSYHEPVTDTGPISLQNHGSEVWFQNIKIRVLPAN